jgi:plasmid stabilization system protein ParE
VLRYSFTDDAVADLDGISDYLSARNPDAAVRVLASIVAAIERACQFPQAAPELDERGDVLGTRKLVERTYRYVIYYRVEGTLLIVLRVFHGSQRRD